MAMSSLLQIPSQERISDSDGDASLARVDAQQKRHAAFRLWERCNVPPKFRSVPVEPDFDKLPTQLEGRAVREPYFRVWTAMIANIEHGDAGAILILIGDRGPGKTHMACTMVKRFCRDNKSAVYHEATDFFLELRATMTAGSSSSELDVERRYLAPSLLVLDAMEEKSAITDPRHSDFQQKMLTRLVNKRHQALKLTLIISNDNGETIADRIGRSLYDRINDGGGILVCDWPSLRGKVNP